MKRISGFLLIALALCGAGAARAATPVPSTVGSNLTAYSGNSGAVNNAMWNTYMNPRANNAVSAPTADFGNCNALILRCAQPKCAKGGCSTMDIARPIVSGCVKSNPSCEQYGEELIEFISAQLVSDANAAAQSAAADAQIAAAQAAAQQTNQQMAAMQQQMVAMQQQMQQQSADTAAQIQAALAQQQAATTQAIADAANTNAAALSSATAQMQSQAASGANTSVTGGANVSGLTTAQQVAAASGVSADVLAREQIAGQILSKIESAEDALARAKAAMNDAFDYAGCDSTGSNCIGPKRVATFKNKAMEFFDPYNDVLDELYDGLILAQSVGVDITDIYMMLNGTCNVWGLYLCGPGQVMHYNNTNCPDGKSDGNVVSGGGSVRGGADCEIGQVVPMSDGGCQLIKMLTDDDEVQRNWLYPETGEGGVQVRVGCASEALDNSVLFRNRRRQADIDIEVLQRMIEQDAPVVFGANSFGQNKSANPDALKYCAVGAETYQDLQTYASLKELPDKVCVPDDDLEKMLNNDVAPSQDKADMEQSVFAKCGSYRGYQNERCLCENSPSNNTQWKSDSSENALSGAGECVCTGTEYNIWDSWEARCLNRAGYSAEDVRRFVDDNDGTRKEFCYDYVNDGAVWNNTTKTCDCSGVSDSTKRELCEDRAKGNYGVASRDF